MYPFYLGMDLHLKRTYVVLMNAEGEVLDKQRLQNSEIANYISENVPKRPMQSWKRPGTGHSSMTC